MYHWVPGMPYHELDLTPMGLHFKQYIKHKEELFIRYPNTEKWVEQGTAELLLHWQANRCRLGYVVATMTCDEVKMLTCVCITMMDEMEWRPGLYVSMLNGMHLDLSVLCFG